MKFTINFTNSPDDTSRYTSSEDLRDFYQGFGCDGLELMPLEPVSSPILTSDMIVGVHTRAPNDWMDLEPSVLIQNYREDLEYARKVRAEYVVFHVTQSNLEEAFTYRLQHTDEEVIDAVCPIINELLDGQGYSFHFLMENLWWTGLNFTRPEMTKKLLDGVHYEKKGFMLDTGHYMQTDLSLRTPKEALASIHAMLDRHKGLLSYIKGIHLNQSLSGDYVQKMIQNPPPLPSDPEQRFCRLFEHILRIDQHLPFTENGVLELVRRIQPLYLTYEYITKNRDEHKRYLEAGTRVFKGQAAKPAPF